MVSMKVFRMMCLLSKSFQDRRETPTGGTDIRRFFGNANCYEAEIETKNMGLVSPNFQGDSYDETRTYH